MAGFFDGEGCVGILKHKKETAQSPSYYVYVSIGQRDGTIMEWIKGNFGGRIYKVKRDGSYQWGMSDRKAYEFLKKITPFLKYKKPQAELAIRFTERVIHERGNEKRFIQLSPHEIKIREEIYQKMKLLKKMFSEPKSIMQE